MACVWPHWPKPNPSNYTWNTQCTRKAKVVICWLAFLFDKTKANYFDGDSSGIRNLFYTFHHAAKRGLDNVPGLITSLTLQLIVLISLMCSILCCSSTCYFTAITIASVFILRQTSQCQNVSLQLNNSSLHLKSEKKSKDLFIYWQSAIFFQFMAGIQFYKIKIKIK